MATKQNVVWAKEAKDLYQEALEFWYNHNQSYDYCLKIIESVENIVSMISEYPYSGIIVKENIRKVVIMNRFVIFYEIQKERIEIVFFFDGRDNPLKVEKI